MEVSFGSPVRVEVKVWLVIHKTRKRNVQLKFVHHPFCIAIQPISCTWDVWELLNIFLVSYWCFGLYIICWLNVLFPSNFFNFHPLLCAKIQLTILNVTILLLIWFVYSSIIYRPFSSGTIIVVGRVGVSV